MCSTYGDFFRHGKLVIYRLSIVDSADWKQLNLQAWLTHHIHFHSTQTTHINKIKYSNSCQPLFPTFNVNIGTLQEMFARIPRTNIKNNLEQQLVDWLVV